MSNQQYRGAQIPDHRSDWLRARPPAPVWTQNLSCPSSGNARLLPVYAGAIDASHSKLVYRKAKAGEHSYAKGTRWETLTGAAYVDQDTLGAGGTNITAAGNATHLGLPCNYITWPAATHSYESSYTGDIHGATLEVGQILLGRLEIALSRALTGDEAVFIRVYGASLTGYLSFDRLSAIMPGAYVPLAITLSPTPVASSGGRFFVYSLTGTFATPLTIYIRRRMLFDATGLDASECVPDFVDPAVDYGFGALGVKWVGTKCCNTVAANGTIIPGEGAALPEPMGVQWQPAATMVNTYSPLDTGAPEVTYLTFTSAPTAVAGLPAKRATASTANNNLHNVDIPMGAPFVGRAVASIVFRKSANARPHLFMTNGVWYSYCYPSGDYSAALIDNTTHGEVASLRSLGNDSYEMTFSANFNNESTPYTYFRLAKDDNLEVYVANGEYLDIASLVVALGAFHGTPLLGSGGATSRLADNPATALPAIGTGPFTAFVDFTVVEEVVGYSYLFYAGHVTCILYQYNNYFVIDSIGSAGSPKGKRSKAIIRRKSSGLISMFVDGAHYGDLAASIYDCVVTPKFFNTNNAGTGAILAHDQWLEYSALSDEDCIRVTRV